MKPLKWLNQKANHHSVRFYRGLFLISPIFGRAGVSFVTSVPIQSESLSVWKIKTKSFGKLFHLKKLSLQSKHAGFQSTGGELISLSIHCLTVCFWQRCGDGFGRWCPTSEWVCAEGGQLPSSLLVLDSRCVSKTHLQISTGTCDEGPENIIITGPCET